MQAVMGVYRNWPVAAKSPNSSPRIESTRNQIAIPRIVLSERSIDRRLPTASLSWAGLLPSGPLRRDLQSGSSSTINAPRCLSNGFHFFPQRFAAALAAIWERLRGLSAAALAAPPFRPPRRPSATAAGFFGFTTGGSVFGSSPMDSMKIRCASSFGSRGRVFERSGIRDPIIPTAAGTSIARNFKLTHYRWAT